MTCLVIQSRTETFRAVSCLLYSPQGAELGGVAPLLCLDLTSLEAALNISPEEARGTQVRPRPLLTHLAGK